MWNIRILGNHLQSLLAGQCTFREKIARVNVFQVLRNKIYLNFNVKCVLVILLIPSLNHSKRITIPWLPWSSTPLTTTNSRAVITKFPCNSLANYWKEWSAIWHVDVFWPPTQLNTYRSQSVDFRNYCFTCYMAPSLSDWSSVVRGFCSY